MQLVKNDRTLFMMIGGMFFLAIVLIILQAIKIEPNIVKVATQYSSYGTTGYYYDHWYTLWTYAILQVLVVMGHAAIAIKLVHIKRRALAIAFLWGSMFLLVVISIFAQSIISVAALR